MSYKKTGIAYPSQAPGLGTCCSWVRYVLLIFLISVFCLWFVFVKINKKDIGNFTTVQLSKIYGDNYKYEKIFLLCTLCFYY